MNEKNTIKELEEQAKNTKNLMDRLNMAYIGMTVDEILKLIPPNYTQKNDKQVE